ncbi:hypothetical protein DD595_26180, partial [Enterobacter cloacae complex sp. 4DZ3-17B2]|uniref:reverse transcriptase domain-containing protein n=1 Tax=Enterobacter cloacae complex sp. 4DZ3-17B2 TaxID=2511990 RepID=UPI0010280CD7
AFAYLDDIIVVTETVEEHFSWLRVVLRRLREANLTINLEKSEFCRDGVKYLGFIVNREGLQVDDDKGRPILDYPPPTNIKQLRRFLGMASWYRRFVPNFASTVAPLTSLLKKNQPWKWEIEQNTAFSKVIGH